MSAGCQLLFPWMRSCPIGVDPWSLLGPDFGRLAVRGRRFPGAPAGPLAAPPFPLTIKPHLLPCLCSSIELVAKYLRLHITVLQGRELMPVISPRGACCAVLCCLRRTVPATACALHNHAA